MSELPRIVSVAPVIYGVLKVVFTDGFEGVVDVRPLIADGEVFDYLRRDHANFDRVMLGDYGHYIFWTDDTGYEIDLGADGLRRDCERQAEVHRLMAS
ncbi:hypothetical protein [Ancylobacter sp.]|uniref:hypothetical protein n=1 Tax=Ancylobacter sp. TaxID=1872567 RepID=UPI003D1317C3